MKVYVIIPRKYEKFVDEELALVKTIYSEVVGYEVVKGSNAKTYISSESISKLKQLEFDKLIIMDKLKPSQIVNIARELRREVSDRILTILEIFAIHAGSKEAQLQVELARLRYMLPLVREAIRYAKLGELHGFLGAGRYGYEKYYLMLKKREAKVRREIEKLREVRSIRRKSREEAGYPHVVIIGYTGAGKTTLFNTITGLSKPVGPGPFTTITPKSHRVSHGEVDFILTDTVGFIRDIPPEIIEAFYATLEEVVEADLIINVVDISKPLEEVENEIKTCSEVLEKLGVKDKAIVYAFNKIDKLGDSYLAVVEKARTFIKSSSTVVPISCIKKINIDVLLDKIAEELRKHGNGEIKSVQEKDIRFTIRSQT